MKNWSALLEMEIPRPCFDRPFVCDGFPSASSVLVIGENPGMPLGIDWWSYWNAETGFNYDAFLAHYSKKKGKAKGTRRMLNRIRENGVKCIETNVYRNEKSHGAGKGEPNIDLLELLIANNENLKVVIAHGAPAQKHMGKLTLPEGVKLYLMRHFTRTRYSEIDQLCDEIRVSDRRTHGT